MIGISRQQALLDQQKISQANAQDLIIIIMIITIIMISIIITIMH